MNPINNETQLIAALAQAKAATILARSMTAEMDAEVAAVKAKFEGKIKTRTDEAEAITKAVAIYADTHRKTLFAEAKSTTLNGHTFGFRDNGGAIKTVKGVTEKKLLERLMRTPGLRKLFVRNKPAIDKDAMKSRWRTWKGPLQKIGARLVSAEAFFLELDVSEDPAVQ